LSISNLDSFSSAASRLVPAWATSEPAATTSRPGTALDPFVSRRRSAAVGRSFWRFIADRWTSFDPLERARAVRMFARFRPDWASEAFAAADRAFYESLPDAFTAYRGQSGAELVIGAAFALSVAGARRQAAGRRVGDGGDGRVFGLLAAKRNVALVFAASGEIVMFPAPRVDLRARRLIEVAN